MGLPVPPDPEYIIPSKWYLHDIRWFAPGTGGCDTYRGAYTCCISSAGTLYDLLYNQCNDGVEICPITGYSTQKTVNLCGPYDSYSDCMAAREEYF